MTKPSKSATEALILTTGNRLTGLFNEIEDALNGEDSSLALWRAEKTLRSLADLARNLAHETEKASHEIEHKQHERKHPRRRQWRLP